MGYYEVACPECGGPATFWSCYTPMITICNQCKEQRMIQQAIVSLMKKLHLATYTPDKQRTLSSGRTSPYYFDVKGAMLHGDISQLIFSTLSKMMFSLKPHFIGGPADGAYLVTTMAVTPYQAGRGFVLRKQRKEHGLGIDVEGWAPKAGHPTVVVDDVITTGESILPVIDFVKAQKANLIAIIAVVDRNEGDKLGEYRKLVMPILRMKDFEPWEEEKDGA